MIITCEECRSEFDVPNTPSLTSRCPYCNSTFQISAPDESGKQQAVFHSRHPGKRVCINCSKLFVSGTTDVIPICPDCTQGMRVAPSQHSNPSWKIIKEGKVFELDSENSLKDWIRKGALEPDDRLISPSGKASQARNFQQFQRVFRSQSEAKMYIPKTSPVVRLVRKYADLKLFVLGIFLILVSCALGWIAYRFFSYSHSVSQDPVLQSLVLSLQNRYPNPTSSPEELVDQARHLLIQNRPEVYALAIKNLEQALVLDPKSPDILGLLAEAYGFYAGQRADPEFQITALRLADLMIRLHPKRIDGYSAKSRVALHTENWSMAKENSQQAMALDPKNYRTRLTRAKVILATGSSAAGLQEVIFLSSSTLERHPRLLEAYDLMGQAYFKLGQPESAISTFEKRLQLAPDDPLALYRFGEIESRAENYVKAKEWFQVSLRTSQNFVPARLNLALIYSRVEKKFKEAERHLRDILTRYERFATAHESLWAKTSLLEILLKTKRTTEALAIAKNLSSIGLSSEAVSIFKAKVFHASGQSKAAVSTLQNDIANHSRPWLSRVVLARLLGEQGHTDQSIEVLRTSIKLNPGPLAPQLNLIQLLIKERRYEEALDVANATVTQIGLKETSNFWEPLKQRVEKISWNPLIQTFKKLVKEKPDSVLVLTLLGLSRLKKGLESKKRTDLNRALKTLRQARKMTGGLEYIHLYLGRTHFALKNWKRAVSSFQQALHINPLSTTARYWLGHTYFRQRKLSAAQKEIKNTVNDENWGFRALYLMGEIAWRQRKKSTAREFWRQSLARESAFVLPWNSLIRHRS